MSYPTDGHEGQEGVEVKKKTFTPKGLIDAEDNPSSEDIWESDWDS